jgi:hypothetical protein
MAYGTDTLAHDHENGGHRSPDEAEAEELAQLRKRVAELEAKLGGRPAVRGGEA